MYIRTFIALAIFLFPMSASAASLYLDPSTGTYGPGDTFIVNIRLNTDGECVNAGNVVLSYPARSLRAVDFGKGASIFTLWVTEPQIDTQKGTISFSGGIPGGYCGRIPGDPALTNGIGKVVFTVTDASAGRADIVFAKTTELYLNDGRGTKIMPDHHNLAVTLVPTPTLSENPWLSEVGADKTPPDSFDVLIESTRSIFGGKYYAVFSTVDKQSGLDHYEIVKNGTWQRATSPHIVDDQTLMSGIQVRAIDKAGNIRLGTYVEGSAPPRATGWEDYIALIIILLLLSIALLARHHLNKRHANTPVDLRS
jgi:hypothetical protein